MYLTNQEIYNLYIEINGCNRYENGQITVVLEGLINQKARLKTKILLQRLSDLLLEDYKIIIEVRNNLSKKKFADFLQKEKEVEIRNLWGEDFELESFSEIVTHEVYKTFYKLFN